MNRSKKVPVTHLFAFSAEYSVALFDEKVSKGLAVLRKVVGVVPGHLGARLLMARAFYSTGQEDLAHQTLQVRGRNGPTTFPRLYQVCGQTGKCNESSFSTARDHRKSIR